MPGALEALVPLLEEIKKGREAFNPENMAGMRNTVEELKSLMTEVRSSTAGWRKSKNKSMPRTLRECTGRLTG